MSVVLISIEQSVWVMASLSGAQQWESKAELEAAAVILTYEILVIKEP